MRKFLFPLIFVFLFVFESTFVQLLPSEAFGSGKVIVPRFLFLAILFLTVYSERKYGLIYGLIFGLLFDIVYTEVIGIYLFLLPLLAYFFSKLMRILQTHIVMTGIASLFVMGLLELAVYEINFIINRTDLSFSSFLTMRLLPTMILNAAFVIIMIYPIKRQSEKFLKSMTE